MYTDSTLVNTIKHIYAWHEEDNDMPLALRLINNDENIKFYVTIDKTKYNSSKGVISVYNKDYRYTSITSYNKYKIDTVYINCLAFDESISIKDILSKITNSLYTKNIIIDKYEKDTFDLSDIVASSVNYYIFPQKNIKKISGTLPSTCIKLNLKIDYSRITSLSGLFANSNLQEINLDMNLRNVTDVSSCFENCTSLESVRGLVLYNVTNFEKLFYNCSKLYTLNRLNLKYANNVKNMFYGCSSLCMFDGFKNANINLDLSDCEDLRRYAISAIVSGLSTTTNKVITFHKYAYNELKDIEKVELSNRGWTMRSNSPLFATFKGDTIFDTKIIPTKDTSIEVMFETLDSDFGTVMGVVSENLNLTIKSLTNYIDEIDYDLSLIEINGNNRLFNKTLVVWQYLSQYKNSLYHIRIFTDKLWIYYNDTDYDVYTFDKSIDISTDLSIYIGGAHVADEIEDTYDNFYGIFHFLKIYQNDTLADWYVPRYKENISCLYNKVRSTYHYAKSGSMEVSESYTQFTKGQEIQYGLVTFDGSTSFNVYSDDTTYQYMGGSAELNIPYEIYDFSINEKSDISSINIRLLHISHLNYENLFKDCTQLTSVTGVDDYSPLIIDNMFNNCSSLVSINGIFDGSNLANAEYAFKNCTELTDFNGIHGITCNLDLGYSPNLTKESLYNIVVNLGNMSDIGKRTLRLNYHVIENYLNVTTSKFYEYIHTMALVKNWNIISSKESNTIPCILIKSFQDGTNYIVTDLCPNERYVGVECLTLNNGSFYMGARDGSSDMTSNELFIIKVTQSATTTEITTKINNSEYTNDCGYQKLQLIDIKGNAMGSTSLPMYIGEINSNGTPTSTTIDSSALTIRIATIRLLDFKYRTTNVLVPYKTTTEFGFVDLVTNKKYKANTNNEYLENIFMFDPSLFALSYGNFANGVITYDETLFNDGNTYTLKYIDSDKLVLNSFENILSYTKN